MHGILSFRFQLHEFLVKVFKRSFKKSKDKLQPKPSCSKLVLKNLPITYEARQDMQTYDEVGSGGGGSVGRAVATNTRDPRFEFQHRQTFIFQLYS